MALMGPKKMFNAKALEQLTSPEQLEQLLQVTSRRSWIALSTLGGLLFLVLLWSVFGQIPMTLDGAGILTYPRRVVSFQAPASGQIASLEVSVGAGVRKGDVIGTLSQPDLQQRLDQERLRLAEVEDRQVQVSGLYAQRQDLEREAIARQREVLQTRIASIIEIAEAQKARNDSYLAEQRANADKVAEIQRVLGRALSERYASYQQLRSEGLTSDDVVLEARQRVIDNELQGADLQVRLQELELKQLEAENAYQQQMDRVAELRSQLQELSIRENQLQQQAVETEADRALEIQELQRSIARLEEELRVRGSIVSEHTGRILEIAAGPGQIVQAGQRIGSIEAEDPDARLIAVGYFSVGDGKKIDPGIAVRVTPSTVERERYGSIVGTVTEVSSFPVTTDAVTSVVGNTEVARELMQGFSKIQVYAELVTDADAHSGYRWTSGKGPKDPITAGTTAAVRATVEYRRPITFVIPLLRRWSGI